MTFGTTVGKPWIEALPTNETEHFTGRTFSRFLIVGDHSSVPNVAEIWATGDHTVEAHAHDSDEILYVLGGAILINGRLVSTHEAVFVPRGTSYAACVATETGSHVLRIELPNGNRTRSAEYDGRIWRGPVTKDGRPALDDA